MDNELKEMEIRLVNLIDSVSQSLSREIALVSQEIRQELGPIRESLERIEGRVSRHGGLIQGGSRVMARLTSWSEDIDEILAKRDKRIDELSRRLTEVEKRLPPQAA